MRTCPLPFIGRRRIQTISSLDHNERFIVISLLSFSMFEPDDDRELVCKYMLDTLYDRIENKCNAVDIVPSEYHFKTYSCFPGCCCSCYITLADKQFLLRRQINIINVNGRKKLCDLNAKIPRKKPFHFKNCLPKLSGVTLH